MLTALVIFIVLFFLVGIVAVVGIKKFNKLKDKYEDVGLEIGNLKSELRDVDDELTASERKVGELRDELVSCKLDLDGYKKKDAENTDAIIALKTSVENKNNLIENLYADKKGLQDRLSEAEKSAENWKVEARKLENQIAEMNS